MTLRIIQNVFRVVYKRITQAIIVLYLTLVNYYLMRALIPFHFRLVANFHWHSEYQIHP